MKYRQSAISEFISRAYEHSKSFGDDCCKAIAEEVKRIEEKRFTPEENRDREFILGMARAVKNKMDRDMMEYLKGGLV
jgi:hypothetical protein